MKASGASFRAAKRWHSIARGVSPWNRSTNRNSSPNGAVLSPHNVGHGSCNVRHLAILLLTLLNLNLAPRCVHSDDAPITLDTIINAWKAREEKAQTFDIRWRSKHFESASYHFLFQNKQLEERKADGTFICRYRLVGDATRRIRFESQGRQWDGNRGDFVDEWSVDIFDGARTTIFQREGPLWFPFAQVRPDNIIDALLNSNTAPLVISFRALTISNAAFGNYKNLKLSKDHVLLANGPEVEPRIEFDPATDFLPVRCVSVNRNRTREVIEINYTKDDAFGWAPQTWKFSLFDESGKILATDESQVIQRYFNKPVGDVEFAADFPVGTLVQGATAREESYIVREGGRRQKIRENDFNGENYKQLLESDPESK